MFTYLLPCRIYTEQQLSMNNYSTILLLNWTENFETVIENFICVFLIL